MNGRRRPKDFYIDCHELKDFINIRGKAMFFFLFAYFPMSQSRANNYSSCKCLSKCNRTKEVSRDRAVSQYTLSKSFQGPVQEFVYFSGFIYTYKEVRIESGRKRDRGLKLLKGYSWREFVSRADTIYSMVLKVFKETNLFEHYNNSRTSLTH